MPSPQDRLTPQKELNPGNHSERRKASAAMRNPLTFWETVWAVTLGMLIANAVSAVIAFSIWVLEFQ
jgi:hypothetical protein